MARWGPSRLDITPRITMPVGNAKPIAVETSPSAAARSCGATAPTGKVAWPDPK
jgi:hypothetical protein